MVCIHANSLKAPFMVPDGHRNGIGVRNSKWDGGSSKGIHLFALLRREANLSNGFA